MKRRNRRKQPHGLIKKVIVIVPLLAALGAVFTFLWLHFVEPKRNMCDEVCRRTGRICHEDTFGDTHEAKLKQRGDFWAIKDRVMHAFPLSPGIPKAVAGFAGVLEHTADPDDTQPSNPGLRPFGAAQGDLIVSHDQIEAACKKAMLTLWQ
jgi:hypothetical protein